MNLVRFHRFITYSSSKALKAVVLGNHVPVVLSAQLPKGFYAWWSSPVAENLNLTPLQRREIRSTVRDYHPHLLGLRAQIQQAELDLEKQFDQDPVDVHKANEAINRLAPRAAT